MKLVRIISAVLSSVTVLAIASCSEFLDAKPDASLAVPNELRDLQLLMDNYRVINNSYPGVYAVLSDSYYLESNIWASLNERDRNMYLWLPDESISNQWSGAYNAIYHCNIVLDNLLLLEYNKEEQELADEIKGNALFFRALYHFSMVNLYAAPYDEKVDLSLGVPLRLSSDYMESSSRGTIRECFASIITDLQSATALLPEISDIKTRASKCAAHGLLAKVYLTMRNYEKALHHADECLQIKSSLVDYNDLDTHSLAPMGRFNDEIICLVRSVQPSPTTRNRARIDSLLYDSYEDSDLRKKVFFVANENGSYSFKGDYDGNGLTSTGYTFAGISTNEIYLIRAEAKVRVGDVAGAMVDLHHLLANRFMDNEVSLQETTSMNEALTLILEEKKKELIFWDSRWLDMRRLRFDAKDFPSRRINDEIFELLPESSHYVLKIPELAIRQTGMIQNP